MEALPVADGRDGDDGECATTMPAHGTAITTDQLAGSSSTRKHSRIIDRPLCAWPPEVALPAPPRCPPQLSSDRFANEHSRFGDSIAQGEDTRPVPNVIFQNGLGGSCKRGEMRSLTRLQLPPIIHFYVHVKFQKVSFPFPPSISTKKYLHRAITLPGHLAACAHLAFDADHVIGLCKHQMQTFCQLVVEVPNTASINPLLQPTRLSFHPRHRTNLHRGTEGGSERSEGLPRIIIPVFPVLRSHGMVSGRHAMARALHRPIASIWGTFGSSDGRMGPALLPRCAPALRPCPRSSVRVAAVSTANCASKEAAPRQVQGVPSLAVPPAMVTASISVDAESIGRLDANQCTRQQPAGTVMGSHRDGVAESSFIPVCAAPSCSVAQSMDSDNKQLDVDLLLVQEQARPNSRSSESPGAAPLAGAFMA